MPHDEQGQDPEIDALVVRARSDREAFGQLYEIYYERILRYCLRRLCRRDVAEDVCSNAFLFVARNMRAFRGETEIDFRRWVYRIATTEVSAYLRSSKRRDELWSEAVVRDRLPATPASDSPPTDEPDWPTIHRAIGRLKEREQTVVTMRLFEGMPHEEIAQVIGVRPAACRAAYSRAMKKLRAELASHFDEASGRALRSG